MIYEYAIASQLPGPSQFLATKCAWLCTDALLPSKARCGFVMLESGVGKLSSLIIEEFKPLTIFSADDTGKVVIKERERSVERRINAVTLVARR